MRPVPRSTGSMELMSQSRGSTDSDRTRFSSEIVDACHRGDSFHQRPQLHGKSEADPS